MLDHVQFTKLKAAIVNSSLSIGKVYLDLEGHRSAFADNSGLNGASFTEDAICYGVTGRSMSPRASLVNRNAPGGMQRGFDFIYDHKHVEVKANAFDKGFIDVSVDQERVSDVFLFYNNRRQYVFLFSGVDRIDIPPFTCLVIGREKFVSLAHPVVRKLPSFVIY